MNPCYSPLKISLAVQPSVSGPPLFTVTLCNRTRAPIEQVHVRVQSVATDAPVPLGQCTFPAGQVHDVSTASGVLTFTYSRTIGPDESAQIHFHCSVPEEAEFRAHLESYVTNDQLCNCKSRYHKCASASVCKKLCSTAKSCRAVFPQNDALGGIFGIVYEKTDATNSFYEDGSDSLSAGATVTLSRAGSADVTVTTDSNGQFHFANVTPADDYVISLASVAISNAVVLPVAPLYYESVTATSVAIQVAAGEQVVFEAGQAGVLAAGQYETVTPASSFGVAFYGSMHGFVHSLNCVPDNTVMLSQDAQVVYGAVGTGAENEFHIDQILPGTYTMNDKDATEITVLPRQEMVANEGQAALGVAPFDPRSELCTSDMFVIPTIDHPVLEFSATGGNVPITIDSTGAGSPSPSELTVPSVGAMVGPFRIELCLEGMHTRGLELEMLLEAPDSGGVPLALRLVPISVLTTADYNGTYIFSDHGRPEYLFKTVDGERTLAPFTYTTREFIWNSSTGGSSPPNGPYVGDFSKLININPVGVWRLWTGDNEPGDNGTISGWSLRIQEACVV